MRLPCATRIQSGCLKKCTHTHIKVMGELPIYLKRKGFMAWYADSSKVVKTTDVKKHPSMTRFGGRGKNLFILGFIVVRAVDMRM